MASANTQAYIDMLYSVEDALGAMPIVYAFDIYRTESKHLAMEIRLHKQPIPERFLQVVRDLETLARMAVHVQNFPEAYINIRYIDHSRIPEISDYAYSATSPMEKHADTAIDVC